MPSRRSALLSLAAALGALPAYAAIDSAPGVCPIDETDVRVAILLATNTLLGHDRDLCPHAVGDDEIRGSISSCSTCGFAGMAKEFKREIPEAVAERVKKELSPAGTPWERWANRARILEWSEARAQIVAESWLRAAWSVRLQERPVAGALGEGIRAAVGALPEQQGKEEDAILDTAKALDAALASKKDAPSGAARAAAAYASGSFWRMRGELAAADERYNQALAAAKGTPLEAEVRDAIARDRASMDLERGYLKTALAHFRAALAAGEDVPRSQRMLVAYLAAECARRTGARDEAQRLYRIAASLGVEGAPHPSMKSLVDQGLAETAPRKTAK